MAGKRPRAGARDRARGRAGRLRPAAARRSPPGAARRLRERAGALVPAVRLHARLGQPLRTHGVRALSAEQAAGVPGARHLLSHAAGVPAVQTGTRGRVASGKQGWRRQGGFPAEVRATTSVWRNAMVKKLLLAAIVLAGLFGAPAPALAG